MGTVDFSACDTRPDNIQAILDSLDRYRRMLIVHGALTDQRNRYNPEKISTFEEYLQSQLDEKTYDIWANLALLKLYVTSLHSKTLDTPGRKPQELPKHLMRSFSIMITNQLYQIYIS
jgi:hypothetical protein